MVAAHADRGLPPKLYGGSIKDTDAVYWGSGIFFKLDCNRQWDMAALLDPRMQEHIHSVESSWENSAAKV